jgi:hypothetical protein
MVPAAVSCGSSHHLFVAESTICGQIFPEPNLETMAQLDRRWQATTAEKRGGEDGFEPVRSPPSRHSQADRMAGQ